MCKSWVDVFFVSCIICKYYIYLSVCVSTDLAQSISEKQMNYSNTSPTQQKNKKWHQTSSISKWKWIQPCIPGKERQPYLRFQHLHIMKYLVSRWPCSWKLQLEACIFHWPSCILLVNLANVGSKTIPDFEISSKAEVTPRSCPSCLPGGRQRCVERRGIHLWLLCLAHTQQTCWDMSELTSVSISVSASQWIIHHLSANSCTIWIIHAIYPPFRAFSKCHTLQSTSTFPSESIRMQ